MTAPVTEASHNGSDTINSLLLYCTLVIVVFILFGIISVFVFGCYSIFKHNKKHLVFQMKFKKRTEKDIHFSSHEENFLKNIIFPEDMTTGWEDICVPKEIVAQLQRQVIVPLKSAKQRDPLHKRNPWQAMPPKGILLTGSPGTGKSLLARTLAKETNCLFLHIRSAEILNMFLGESEKIVKAIFSLAKKLEPCMIFIDDVDSVFGNRNDQKSGNYSNISSSIKGNFLSFWDGITIESDKERSGPIVIVVGATSRHQNCDPNFLRRFDLNIEIPLPTLLDRQLILEIQLKGLKRDKEFDTKKLAAMTNGFSGADLKEVVRHASLVCSDELRDKMSKGTEDKMIAEVKSRCQNNSLEAQRTDNGNLKNNITVASVGNPTTSSTSTLVSNLVHELIDQTRLPGISTDSKILNTVAELKDPRKSTEGFQWEMTITMAQMIKSIEHSKKSRSKSGGGFGGLDEYEIVLAGHLIQPKDLDVTWKHIAGLNDVIREIKKHVIIPIAASLHRGSINSQLVNCPKGILFHGPPGSGKTLLAKALAYHSRCAFINVDVSTLQNKYYGDSQKLTSALFRLAEKYQPSIIFIDEIDAFLRQRQSQDHEITATTKAQFLSLWDGILTDPNKVVIVMGASNRPDDIDPAVLRRLTKKFKISLPNLENRVKILKLILDKENVAANVNFKTLALLTDGFSPSDLKEMACTAAINSLKATVKMNKEDALASGKSFISLELYALDSSRSLAGSWSIMDANFNGALTVKEITPEKFLDAIELIKKAKVRSDEMDYNYNSSIYS